LAAAVAAQVKRFIPSDFSLDFTKTTPGNNRNLDLRREFHAKLDQSGIEWTSILCGGFMELVMSPESPFINDRFHRCMHFGPADQKLDFSLIPDVAAYTALVAADPNPTPKYLRIAGDVFTMRELAETVTRVKSRKYTTMWLGNVNFLRIITSILKFFIGGVEDKLLPPWQGMQYLENMVSGVGKLEPLDNERYPEMRWTSMEMALKNKSAEEAKSK
jgi:hypothetical protein